MAASNSEFKLSSHNDLIHISNSFGLEGLEKGGCVGINISLFLYILGQRANEFITLHETINVTTPNEKVKEFLAKKIADEKEYSSVNKIYHFLMDARNAFNAYNRKTLSKVYDIQCGNDRHETLEIILRKLQTSQNTHKVIDVHYGHPRSPLRKPMDIAVLRGYTHAVYFHELQNFMEALVEAKNHQSGEFTFIIHLLNADHSLFLFYTTEPIKFGNRFRAGWWLVEPNQMHLASFLYLGNNNVKQIAERFELFMLNGFYNGNRNKDNLAIFFSEFVVERRYKTLVEEISTDWIKNEKMLEVQEIIPAKAHAVDRNVERKYTWLDAACLFGHVDTIKRLLKASDVENIADLLGMTIQSDNADAVSFILNRDDCILSEDAAFKALNLACQYNKRKIAVQLLQHEKIVMHLYQYKYDRNKRIEVRGAYYALHFLWLRKNDPAMFCQLLDRNPQLMPILSQDYPNSTESETLITTMVKEGNTDAFNVLFSIPHFANEPNLCRTIARLILRSHDHVDNMIECIITRHCPLLCRTSYQSRVLFDILLDEVIKQAHIKAYLTILNLLDNDRIIILIKHSLHEIFDHTAIDMLKQMLANPFVKDIIDDHCEDYLKKLLALKLDEVIVNETDLVKLMALEKLVEDYLQGCLTQDQLMTGNKIVDEELHATRATYTDMRPIDTPQKLRAFESTSVSPEAKKR